MAILAGMARLVESRPGRGRAARFGARKGAWRRLGARLREERGQMVPGTLVLMVLLIAAGLLAVWLGLGTERAARAQTAADAAALAAEQTVVQEIQSPAFVGGAIQSSGVLNYAAICGSGSKAAYYAAVNHAQLTGCQPVPSTSSMVGYDVQVYVRSTQPMPSGTPDAGHEATARAQASTDPFAQGSPNVLTAYATTQCDPSAAPPSVPVFSAHGGRYGLFAAAGVSMVGCGARIAGALDELGQAQKLRLTETVGYTASDAHATAPAKAALGCGAAAIVPAVSGLSVAELAKFDLTRPFPAVKDEVELSGVSCGSTTRTSVDATSTQSVSLGNMNVHLVPWGGGPQGSFLGLVGGGSSSIGETPLQVGCQVYRVWQALHVNQELLLIGLMVAQDESDMGQNIGPNTTDPSQSIGVFQQISDDGWGTPAEELNVTDAAEMFYLGAHSGLQGASTEGLMYWYGLHPTAPTYELAQDTQGSGAGQNSDGLDNYGRPSNVAAAQQIESQVLSGACGKAGK